MPAILGIHQSSGLSEISSQFHDECSAVSGFFCIDSWPSSVERKNLVLGPATFVTGCRPMVLVTTPPQPASKARMILLSDSVGGADDSRNGFWNASPVNVTDKSAVIRPPNAFGEKDDYTRGGDGANGVLQRRNGVMETNGGRPAMAGAVR